MPMQQAWTAASDAAGAYGTAMQAPPTGVQHYQFPTEPYVKDENSQQQNYTWNQS